MVKLPLGVVRLSSNETSSVWLDSVPLDASRQSNAAVWIVVGTATVTFALATSLPDPIAKIVCDPLATPVGSVTETFAVPFAGTGLGVIEPVRT